MTEYIIPEWWDWHSNPADEIPPGLLALACVRPAFGGGTAVIGGSMNGNTHISSARQADAAARQHGVRQVNAQLDSQQRRTLTKRVNHNG